MHKNVTAIYRTHLVAQKVKSEIEDLGLSGRHVDIVPDRHDDVATTGERDAQYYRDDLDHMGLPDTERHTYDQALRRGDYVVSVRVNKDDEDHMGRITEIMRHPEAHDFDRLDAEFRDTPKATYDPQTGAMVGRRDTTYDYGGSTVRGYDYDEPYTPRTERA